jgi:hypothetical protein
MMFQLGREQNILNSTALHDVSVGKGTKDKINSTALHDVSVGKGIKDIKLDCAS